MMLAASTTMGVPSIAAPASSTYSGFLDRQRATPAAWLPTISNSKNKSKRISQASSSKRRYRKHRQHPYTRHKDFHQNRHNSARRPRGNQDEAGYINATDPQDVNRNVNEWAPSTKYSPPVANKTLDRRPYFPPQHEAAKVNSFIAAAVAPSVPERSRKFLAPASFVGLLDRTLEDSLKSIERSNKGYNSSRGHAGVDNVVIECNSSSVLAIPHNGTVKESSSPKYLTNSSLPSSLHQAKPAARLEYDPYQPQHSPTYEPDPFRDDKEYSPLFPGWYD